MSRPKPSTTAKWGRTLARVAKRSWGNIAFVALAASVLFTFGALGFAMHHAPLTAASGTGPAGPVRTPRPHVDKPTCGDPGLPACKQQNDWIPIHSEAPGDIIAAARQSTLFTVDRSGNGDFVHDLSHLGVPEFVQALQTQANATYPDFYEIPIHDTAGATMAVASCELDAAHHNSQVISIETYTQPHADGQIARMHAQDALNAVAAQHHTTLRSGAQSRLVYFPVDSAAQLTGKITWVAGGESPVDPVWLVPGADGQDHIVGADGHVYLRSELPAPPGA